MAVTAVSRVNFKDIFPKFKAELDECNFVAIDAEFSGVTPAEQDLFSLFDTPAERFKKMRLWPFRIIQFGTALFKFDVKTNEWITTCYNFMVFPVAFETPNLTEPVLCQASSLLFLRQHNFDFNKWISDGIPYMNAQKAEKVAQYLQIYRSCLQTGCSVDKSTLLMSEVCRRRNLESNNNAPLTDVEIAHVVEDLTGFSHVIRAVSNSRKFVIGHNVYMDLFLIYKDFCDALPATYEEFKSEVHRIFPEVLDTKRLAHGVRDALAKRDSDEPYFDPNNLVDTSLFALHFNSRLKEPGSPKILVGDKYKPFLEESAVGKGRIENIPNSPCHEAAFDACVTGCLFIQLAYLLERPSLRFRISHATAGDLLFASSPWLNMVNAVRCTVPYIDLGGEDPASHRPPHIIVTGCTQQRWNLRRNLKSLHKNLPKFGDYDIRLEGEKIVITCGSYGCHTGVTRYLIQEGFLIEDRGRKFFAILLDHHKFRIGVGSACVVIGAGALWCLLTRLVRCRQ